MRNEKFLKTVEKMIVKIAIKSATSDANSACVLIGYQPKMKEEVKKLRKF